MSDKGSVVVMMCERQSTELLKTKEKDVNTLGAAVSCLDNKFFS